MKFSARFYTFIIIFLILLVGFLSKLPQKTLAAPKPWESFQPSFDRFEDDEINSRAKEFQNPELKYVHGGRVKLFEVGNVLSSGIVLMSGWSQKAEKTGYFDKREMGGAIGTLAQSIETIYASPPASGFAWLGDTLANAGLIAQPAYAQGIGFAGLTPLLSLWKTSRNISYAVLIIIMVAIGFMVIFRAKIDPKTVISVQAALPKIILTLILITFSYPIAGFMIDLMYLAMAIVIKMLATGLSGVDLPSGLEYLIKPEMQQTEFITGGWGKLWNSVFNLNLIIPFVGQGLFGSIQNLSVFSVASTIGAVIGGIIQGGGLATIALGGQGALVGAFLPALLILFMIFLGLLFTLFRLTFLLVNSYLQVLISVILGPLLLLREAIPGQSAFSEWIQNLVANLIVFPATAAVIYFSWIMTAVTWKGNLWGAPLIPFGGGGNSNGNPLAIFMGLGIIFLAPNLVASIKKAFHPKPSLPITSGSAFAPLTGGAQTAMGAGQQFYYMKQVFGGDERAGSKGAASGLFDKIRVGVFGGKKGG